MVEYQKYVQYATFRIIWWKKLVYNCQESYLKQKYEIKNAKGVNNSNLLIYYTCLSEPSFILSLDLGYFHCVAADETKIF